MEESRWTSLTVRDSARTRLVQSYCLMVEAQFFRIRPATWSSGMDGFEPEVHRRVSPDSDGTATLGTLRAPYGTGDNFGTPDSNPCPPEERFPKAASAFHKMCRTDSLEA